uniref:PUM-HD domain-containing protein n=1 Tax=Alexandrium catenella TaxID=2925 RepID=A0A7S1MJW5_ALECA
MVCASNLASALPAGSQMAWMPPMSPADRSEKDQWAVSGSWQTPGYQVLGLPQGVPDGCALQMAPLHLLSMPVAMCDVVTQQQQQAATWPFYAASVQEPPSVPSSLQTLEEQEHQGMQPPSTSAKRRQRRQRAAERRTQVPGQLVESCAANSELSSPRGGLASNDCAETPVDCAALTRALEAGGEEREAALAMICRNVDRLAFEREGCRLVQEAFQLADSTSTGALVGGLHGHVLEAVDSQHANYVIQAVVTALPTAMSSFVVKEILGSVTEVARHRFGCRILCRLVEHSGGSDDLAALCEELLAEAGAHCQHPFAHYVIECILEHLPEYGERIVRALRADLWGNARHRSGSHVVEAALAYGSEADRHALALQLLGSGRDAVLSLAQSQYGSFVLRAVLQVPCDLSEEAFGYLHQAALLLEGAKCGQRLLEDLGLRAVVAK